MQKSVFVIGNGMTEFVKPNKSNGNYEVMCSLAINRALRDCNIQYKQIEQAFVGYVYGDSCSGQRALYKVGMTGIPIINVNNNCCTGSAALHLGIQAIKSGQANCVLCLGFDKMQPGSLQRVFNDRSDPLGLIYDKQQEILNKDGKIVKGAPQIFGNAAIQYMQKNPKCNSTHLDKIAYKNHLHSINNPYSQNMQLYTLDQISKSTQIYGPLTKLHCCPTSDGAAAVILCSEEFMIKNNLMNQAVEIIANKLLTDSLETFKLESNGQYNQMNLAGYEMTKNTANAVFEQIIKDAKYNSQYKSKQDIIDKVKVVELHDCFSANELITYEALSLCEENKAHEYIDKEWFTYGGKCVVNPSGGLISKGHPLGATGLAQCNELCWQLRNMAMARQVQNARNHLALQHNLGLGGACFVALYQKYNQNINGDLKQNQTQDLNTIKAIENLAQSKPKL